MTLQEISIILAESVNRELDVPFRLMIQDRIKAWRNKLLKDSLERNPQSRKFYQQAITIPMEKVAASECGHGLACEFVYRSTVELPEILRTNDMMFDYVGATNGSTPWKFIPVWELPIAAASTYSSLVRTYAILNRRIVTLKPVNAVLAISIFADPVEAALAGCVGSGSENCNPDLLEYPIPADMVQQIIQYVTQVDFNKPELNLIKPDANATEDQK